MSNGDEWWQFKLQGGMKWGKEEDDHACDGGVRV